MLKITLIRHGTSVGNQKLRMMGQLNDELSTTGIAESECLAKQLSREGDRPSAIYCSPQKRAVQTAQILLAPFLNQGSQARSSTLGQSSDLTPIPKSLKIQNAIPMQLCDDLKELHGGIFEGLTWAQAKTRHPDLCLQLEQSLDLISVPHGESPESGFRRACQFWDDLFCKLNLKSGQAHSVIWIVTHSGILQHLIAALLGCDRTWGIPISNTARFEFWIDGDRWHQLSQNHLHPNRHNTSLWQIQRFNDISHLTSELWHQNCSYK